MIGTDKKDKCTAWFIFLVFLIYYGINCPPGITVEDSGDFIMGLSTLGIVHGPSFPLYTMIGFIFSKLPIGEVGFRIAFLSSFFGAATLSVLFLTLRLLKLDILAALISILSLGLTTVFMGQSVIAEVYTLNTFFVIGLFYLSLCANITKSNISIFLMGLTTSSGLIHHYPLFLTSCVGLVFIFDWKILNIKNLFWGVTGFILGLLPFLYLVIQMKNPSLDYNFGKVSNWEMLWKQFLREGYSGVDEAGGTFKDKLLLSFSVLKLYLFDFKILIIPIILGLVKIKKTKAEAGFLISTITSCYLIIFLLGFTADEHYQAVIKAYLLPHFIFLSLYLAKGLNKLLQFEVLKRQFQVIALSLCVLIQGATNFANASHFNDDFAYLWAKNALESLEKNSVLILCGQEPYVLYYLNHFKKIRPDVTIYDRLSIMTEKNLYEPVLLFWKVKSQKQFENFRKVRELDFFKKTNRPIYFTCTNKFEGYEIKLEPTVYFYRLINHIPFNPPEKSKVIASEIIQSAIEGYPKSEYWLDVLRNMVLFNSYTYYVKYSPESIPTFLSALDQHKNSKNTDFIHSMAEHAYKAKNLNVFEHVIGWADTNLGLSNLGTPLLSRLCSVRAEEKKLEVALQYCQKALQTSKPCNVSLLNNLLFLSYNLKKIDEAKIIAEEILLCKPEHKGANSLLRMTK